MFLLNYSSKAKKFSVYPVEHSFQSLSLSGIVRVKQVDHLQKKIINKIKYFLIWAYIKDESLVYVSLHLIWVESGRLNKVDE